MRKNYGITLISFVLTSVILIILAGVIFINTGNFIVNKAITVYRKMDSATRCENDELKWIENYGASNYNEVILKYNVKIGDYIEYPFEYNDVYTGEYYNMWNGWRVVDIDDFGCIKIISTGIPAEWYYEVGDSNIKDNFKLLSDCGLYNKNSIIASKFKIDGIASKIQNLSLSDLNNLCNKIYGAKRSENDTSRLIDSYELFYLPDEFTYYWLSTNDVNDNEKLYYVSHNSIESEKNYRLGIRPVITLNENLVGIFSNSVWKYVH